MADSRCWKLSANGTLRPSDCSYLSRGLQHAAWGIVLTLGFAGCAEQKKSVTPTAKPAVEHRPRFQGTPTQLYSILNDSRSTLGTLRDEAKSNDSAKRVGEAIDRTLDAADSLIEHPAVQKTAGQKLQRMKLEILFEAATIDHGEYDKRLNSLAANVIKETPKGDLADFAATLVLARELLGDKLDHEKIQAALVEYHGKHPDSIYGGDLFESYATRLEQEKMKTEAVAIRRLAKESFPQPPSANDARADGNNPFVRRSGNRLVGSTLEVFGPTLAGPTVNLSEKKGKVVLVVFWAAWCEYSTDYVLDAQKVYDKRHRDGFEILGISLDMDRESLRSFVTSSSIPWPQIIYHDPEDMGFNNPVATRYGVDAIPASLLVGRNGKVIAVDVPVDRLDYIVEQSLE